ncbi:DUF5682 family protein [Actinomyces israelii]|uniref:DUF5682 family protein n=1 Tax=Actinomyces israelii TaxID=1659 RepID=UPI002556FF14|nr:DUF5682 family protein [Actinomyces israelii]WKR22835.1 hypothetical protein AIF0345_2791 [Actinomyces israelii]
MTKAGAVAQGKTTAQKAAAPAGAGAAAPSCPAQAPPVRVLGVRHHGPGSARALVAALEAYRPDCVLVEGPADADDLLAWVGAREAGPDDARSRRDDEVPAGAEAVMEPPVALLAWKTDEPSVASFWPLAVFSPEWQALRWAAENDVEAHFMDLPARHVLAREAEDRDESGPGAGDGTGPGSGAAPGSGASPHAGEPAPAPEDAAPDEPAEPAPADAGPAEALDEAPDAPPRADPVAELARLAGYEDPEAWWEDAVELRMDADPFDPLADAIGMLREAAPETDPWTLRREAHMRRVLRAARRRGHERVAVVCGAWHAPALKGRPPTVKSDNALLSGLPKVRARLTWVPWTHGRLAAATGYRAGVGSPGWYHHLFTAPDEPIVRWLTLVARSLREHDLPASSAHVIEAARLAEALAALRGRPMPGLDEVGEATWSVLCEGSGLRAELVTREVVVGQALGRVPDGVPMVPLDADMRATARRLRLAFSASARSLVLDLRKPNDLARSHLLRRLAVLGIGWGSPQRVSGTGTFKEAWDLQWRPELAVDVVEAAAWGTTVASAAGNALLARTATLPEVTGAIEEALAADLGEVLPELLRALDERAAGDPDVVHLLASIPSLARAQRYGDVRATDTRSLAQVTRAVLARACAGLPAAASGVGPEPAASLRTAVDGVQDVVALLGEEEARRWRECLLTTLRVVALPGLLAGRIVRLLLDSAGLTAAEAAERMSRALSRGADPEEQAAWIEGFLSGSALLVVEDRRILGLLDEWVGGIDDRAFIDVLPALRRAMGSWSRASRRELARRIASGGPRRAGAGSGGGGEDGESGEDELLAFAAPVLATVGTILGGGR